MTKALTTSGYNRVSICRGNSSPRFFSDKEWMYRELKDYEDDSIGENYCNVGEHCNERKLWGFDSFCVSKGKSQWFNGLFLIKIYSQSFAIILSSFYLAESCATTMKRTSAFKPTRKWLIVLKFSLAGE